MRMLINRKNQGITLVALVITIIILLILAGISIAQLTGNGLFEKAKLAKGKSENAQIEENATLANYENELDKYLSSSRVDPNGNNQLRKLGTLTGKGSETSNYLELEECNEIIVTFRINYTIVTITIPYQELTNEIYYYYDGLPAVTSHCSSRMGEVGCTSSKIWIEASYLNNTNYVNDTEVNVYYK